MQRSRHTPAQGTRIPALPPRATAPAVPLPPLEPGPALPFPADPSKGALSTGAAAAIYGSLLGTGGVLFGVGVAMLAKRVRADRPLCLKRCTGFTVMAAVGLCLLYAGAFAGVASAVRQHPAIVPL